MVTTCPLSKPISLSHLPRRRISEKSPTFNINPIEEIKKLHEEKIALYERMLKEKDEMMARLERLMEGK
jgi:hypothetical protein